MPLTHAEIDAFRDFAVQQVNNGGVESLSCCLRMWDDQREYAEQRVVARDLGGERTDAEPARQQIDRATLQRDRAPHDAGQPGAQPGRQLVHDA